MSSPRVLGLSLVQQFHHEPKQIVYLSLKDGQISKQTTIKDFQNRIEVAAVQQNSEGFRFSFRLSLLQTSDTNLYFCTWSRVMPHLGTTEFLSSNGTVIIIRGEEDHGK